MFNPRLIPLATAFLICFAPATGRAETVTFRFLPTSPSGQLTQVAAGPNGALGERRTGLGLTPEAYPYAVPPNQMVTLRHPTTGGTVTVPLRLPQSTPRIQHRADRTIFNYGSYAVSVIFNADGSISTVYSSGPFRPLAFE